MTVLRLWLLFSEPAGRPKHAEERLFINSQYGVDFAYVGHQADSLLVVFKVFYILS